MKTSEKVLELLERNPGEYISGEEIAETLQVSRNTVWKAVKSLINEGYKIDASSNKGYRFGEGNDIISKSAVQCAIDTDKRDLFSIEIRESVSSTNTVLKELAAKGAREGHVLIALSQTGGKGRMGRSFYSPKGTGVYFSLLLEPKLSAEDSVFITTAAAVALCIASKEVLNADTSIKWVNDVYADDKKICGILTEAVLDLNSNTVDHVVLGVGVNIYEPEGGFPEEIKNVAGNLVKEKLPFAQSRLIGRFLSEFYKLYRECDLEKIAALYREFNFTVGKKINVISGDNVRPALAVGIDNRCRLEVIYEDTGEKATLQAGEISIRLNPPAAG